MQVVRVCLSSVIVKYSQYYKVHKNQQAYNAHAYSPFSDITYQTLFPVSLVDFCHGLILALDQSEGGVAAAQFSQRRVKSRMSSAQPH